MGAEQLAPSPRESAAATCPSCTYDLRGLALADGVTCPECGLTFTAAQLIARRNARVWWRDVSPWLFVASCVVIAGLLFLQGSRRGNVNAVAAAMVLWPPVLMCGLAIKPVGRGDRVGRGVLWPSLGIALLMCAIGLVVRDTGRDEILLGGMLALNTVPLGAWALIWLCPPRPNASAALVFLSIVPGFAAAVLIGTGLYTYAIGEHWTAWADPRPGYIYDQWPMDWLDAIVYGALLLVPTVFLVAMAVLVRLDARSRRASLVKAGAA